MQVKALVDESLLLLFVTLRWRGAEDCEHSLNGYISDFG